MNGKFSMKLTHKISVIALAATFLAVATVDVAPGQDDGPNSSLFSGRFGPYVRQAGPEATSWYEVPLPPAKEVKVNDIVTIRVDLGAQVISEAEMQRRKNGVYDALLNNWVLLNGLKSVKPAPMSDGEPRVTGALNQLYRATGEMETVESLKFEIAAKVAAVLPNGNLVLEAHRQVVNNDEVWMHSLTGVCRREDVGPGNMILSEDIADLEVSKREHGHVRDSYKRGWFTLWLDRFNPF
jgi:flagellar L-ring protein precursor FlgH